LFERLSKALLLASTLALTVGYTLGGASCAPPENTAITCDCYESGDFYIIFETIWYSLDNEPLLLLSTKDCLIGTPKSYGQEGCYLADYCMPREDLMAIQNAIIEYDIKSYKGIHHVPSEFVRGSPLVCFRILFYFDGETHTILYESALPTLVRSEFWNLGKFTDVLWHYYYNNDAYLSLPKGGQWPY